MIHPLLIPLVVISIGFAIYLAVEGIVWLYDLLEWAETAEVETDELPDKNFRGVK